MECNNNTEIIFNNLEMTKWNNTGEIITPNLDGLDSTIKKIDSYVNKKYIQVAIIDWKNQILSEIKLCIKTTMQTMSQ